MKSARSCPYCEATAREHLGIRLGAPFVRCGQCASIYMDITRGEFDSLHTGAFETSAFADDIVSVHGNNPDHRTWAEVAPYLPGHRLLEIGPGTGHLLAAAAAHGRAVSCVEHSAAHRDFIRRTWNVSSVYGSMAELSSAEPPVDAVLSINTFEHVYDVREFLRDAARRLAPKGAIFISTPNAHCILTRVAGVGWSAFKERDHVSFPSRDGLERLAARCGLRVQHAWTGELPLETPIGVAVAARDLVFERRPSSGGAAAVGHARRIEDHAAARPMRKAVRALARLAMKSAARVDLTRIVTSRLGVAATIKAVFVAA
jgi:2-polyprenyl-3-methyl-5-hydroxy-6-metoxy-1,4-benzoquinol methylase